MFSYTTSTVTSTYQGHTAVFYVFSDALKIEGVRINVSANIEQQIADRLGCLLLTPKLADMIWEQRTVTLPPMPRPITSATSAMIDNSAKIDAALAAQGNPPGLVSTTGKHWVIDQSLASKPGKACNYGWHFAGSNFQGLLGEVAVSLIKDSSGQYLRLIQGRGWAHDMSHVDYSQICVLVQRNCTVDGQDCDLVDLLKDPVLSYLASNTGVMTIFRQPGVPEYSGPIVMPQIVITPDDASTNA